MQPSAVTGDPDDGFAFRIGYYVVLPEQEMANFFTRNYKHLVAADESISRFHLRLSSLPAEICTGATMYRYVLSSYKSGMRRMES